MKWLKKIIPEVIRCDESDYLIWKWHPQGTLENRNDRENRIYYGSELRVKENSIAVFFCPQTNGTIIEFHEGPCDVILETENVPVLSEINRLFQWQTPPTQAEVYFLNLSKHIQMRFGVPFFKIKSNDGNHFNMSVRGKLVYGISDPQQFLSVFGLKTMWPDDLKDQLRDNINSVVKKTIIEFCAENNAHDFENDTEEISYLIQAAIKKKINNGYGIKIVDVIISAFDIE